MTVEQLPTLNAILNSLCTMLLLGGYWAIKKGNEPLHKKLMLGAVGVSLGFLTSYLIYHYNVGHVKFTGTGWIRPVYFALLISHILGAIVQAPLVIATVVLGLLDQRKGHRRIAPFTWWVWLYVSITGVIVYLLLYVLYSPH